MAKRPGFSLPEGLKLEITADRIDLEYDGDVHLAQTLGRALGAVVAGGDLTLEIDRVQGDLRAGGTLRITGDVDAERLHAREIVLGKQSVKCRSISADERITIGPGTLNVEVIIAPEITIDPKAQGRVTVIESTNERGATKIKGGFSLADYEDMIGGAQEFLEQRGLRPLGKDGPSPAARPAPAPAPAAKAEPPPIKTEPPPVKAGKKEKEKEKPREEEDVDDPLSLSLDDLEPLVDGGEAKPSDDDLYARLSDALGRISACYEGTDLPPAVEELRELVEQRDYDALRQNITEVWNGLLGFHQKRGIRPHHQVTHAFNVIHGLVQA